MDTSSKIYVAGHRGMVGSAIVRCLRRQGYQHIIGREHTELDLKNQIKVEAFFEKERPEYVFMAAAKVGGIRANALYPADFLMDNLLIQNNIILMANQFQCKKLLFLASSCIYPKECHQPMKEEELLSGELEPTNEPYSLAKIAGIKACQYFNQQYGTHFITAMPANSYGPNDNFNPENSHVIPALLRRFHEAKLDKREEVIMWGSGKAMREFLYVDDLAEASVFLMNRYDESGFINIGSGSEVSMLELASIIRDVVGYPGNIVLDTSKPDGMMRRMVDSGRIRALGWKPKVGLKEGIVRLYRYFLERESN